MENKNIWKHLLLVTACFIAFDAASQEFAFRRYVPSDGLAGEVVHNAMQDSYGFLWMSTGNGLSRFDGKTFKNYAYTEGLQDLAVICTYEDKYHRLWAGTTKGIVELRNGRFVTNSNTTNDIFYVYSFNEIDSIGLVAFTDKGAYHYKNSIWTKTNLVQDFNTGGCMESAVADSGFYLSCTDQLVYKQHGLPMVSMAKDLTDKREFFCSQLSKVRGRVFAAIHNQLFELIGGKMELLIDSIPITHYFYFAVDTGNVYWINIAGKGLYKYQLLPQNKNAVTIYEYDSNTSGHPFFDSQHNLWITSYEGLVKVLPKIFENVTPRRQSGVAKRLNVIPAKNNEVIVSDAAGLSLLRDGRSIHFEKPASYKDNTAYQQDFVEGFAKDNRDYTWMITRHRKLLCWNGSQLLDYSNLMPPEQADYIRNLTVNPLNNIVFACGETSLLCGNEKKMGAFIDSDGKSFSKTTAVLFTHNGIGVVNEYQKGIYFITRTNKIIKAGPALDIIDKGSYTYFFEDNEGWIWISNAGKGLVHFRIDGDSYKVEDLTILTTEQGLPANKVADMVFDSEGNKWVSCSNGLAVLKHNPADSSTWDIYTIGKEQNIELTSPVAMAADKAGNVWVASLDKIIRINARKLFLKKVQPSITIEKVSLDMKETNWLQYTKRVDGYFQLPYAPVLSYSQNTLGIEFSGISVYNADYFEYSYRLEPLDKEWSSPSPNNYISLIKLSPGTYIFKVKARGKGTMWSTPAIFSFTIMPPFWENWASRVAVIALAAWLIIAVYRSRIKKIQRNAYLQNQLRDLEMKALKAQMNPHFIYNALNSIQSLIADEKRSEAINYIGTFSRLLRHVLEYTENNVISLEKELQTLKLYIQLESLRLNMALQYTITVSDELITENEKLPPLILQPFVENALWHGLSRKEGEKHLTIGVSQSDNYLLFSITDNGIGREKAAAFKMQSTRDFYDPKGIDITVKRLVAFNKSNDAPAIYEDLKDEANNPLGTRVIIRTSRHFS